MLGPSGSGKTTCLRMIGGFTLPTSGRILIGGQDVSHLPPYARPVNTVFQDYALFPHMNIRDNVAYGLMVQGVEKAQRHARAEQMLDLVRLSGVGARRPGQLSGGQRQRVALARALINQPQVLLLDEPLGALDLKLREQMQTELKALQRQLGITFLFITHDQHEALSMSDRIGVFNNGRLEQVGAPQAIYNRPATRFVAEFVGAANVFDGARAREIAGVDSVMLRPERIRLGAAPQARLSGAVIDAQYFGSFSRVRVDWAGEAVSVDLNPELHPELPTPGDTVHLHWQADAVHPLQTAGARTMSVALTAAPQPMPRAGALRWLSDLLYTRRGLLLAALLGPPLLWFGVVYLGSLFALLANSFFTLDEFSGVVDRSQLSLNNFREMTSPANVDVVLRTVLMAVSVTLACGLIAFPIAYYMARYARGPQKALLYIAVMLPLWSSYLVRLYAWKLLLAKEGAISWVLAEVHMTWLLDALLSTPGIGGNSLSFSRLGTFIVFVYMWLPFMILPIQAAIERIPGSLLEASSDLGARSGTTFWQVIFPLAMPGIAAGSIFTFSLTLGDYIIPQVIGDSTLFIGQVVYRQQGVAGNVPFAAAFSLVPIVVIGVYLWIAKKLGAFDAL